MSIGKSLFSVNQKMIARYAHAGAGTAGSAGKDLKENGGATGWSPLLRLSITTEPTVVAFSMPHPGGLLIMSHFAIVSTMDMSFFIHSFTMVVTSTPFFLENFLSTSIMSGSMYIGRYNPVSGR